MKLAQRFLANALVPRQTVWYSSNTLQRKELETREEIHSAIDDMHRLLEVKRNDLLGKAEAQMREKEEKLRSSECFKGQRAICWPCFWWNIQLLSECTTRCSDFKLAHYRALSYSMVKLYTIGVP